VRWATQERVLLEEAQGTVWHGSALLTLSGGAGSQDARRLPTRVHWQWAWGAQGLSLGLASACCTPAPLEILLGREAGHWQLKLQDQQSQWPLALLSGLGAPWNTLQAEGRLHWQSTGLRLHWQEGQLHWRGQTQVLVKDLASRLSTLRPMGSYRLAWHGQAAGTPQPVLTLETLNGPLQLSGQGQWTGQRLRFAGEASAEAGSEAALANLLNILGRRDGARSLLSLG
jgi:general secretion pathway protein N